MSLRSLVNLVGPPALLKHWGPGPHPGTGTPQKIHAPGGGIHYQVADDYIRSQIPNLIKHFGEPEGGFADRSGIRSETYKWLNDIHDKLGEGSANYPIDIENDRDRVWQLFGDIEGDNKRDLLIQLAKGDITIAEATTLGLSEYDQEVRDIGPLPRTLYHVTTDASSVEASGLKARDELAQERGIGLGGGTNDTISFTADPVIANDIYQAMLERHAVLNDPAKYIPQLVREAKQGVGADRPWWGSPEQTSTLAMKWEGNDPELSGGGIETLVEGKFYYTAYGGDGNTVEELRAKWADTKHTTYFRDKYDLDSIKLLRPAGAGQRAFFEVRYTEEGHAEAIGDFMDEYSVYRESAGGRMDPLFISNDDLAFKNKDPKDFGIVIGHSKPGTRGYKLSALGEWRTWTGEVLEDYEVQRPKYFPPTEPADDGKVNPFVWVEVAS